MKKPYWPARVIISACFILTAATLAFPQSVTPNLHVAPKGTTVTEHARGTFEVKLNPQEDQAGDPTVKRMSIDKQIHGDLEGASKGQMLTAMTEIKGSAGYVAIERVTGTLHGRTGTFALQHSATMNRGVPQLSINVVPDSGTGQLTGITGKFDIQIDSGKHSYDFEYTLPEAP